MEILENLKDSARADLAVLKRSLFFEDLKMAA